MPLGIDGQPIKHARLHLVWVSVEQVMLAAKIVGKLVTNVFDSALVAFNRTKELKDMISLVSDAHPLLILAQLLFNPDVSAVRSYESPTLAVPTLDYAIFNHQDYRKLVFIVLPRDVQFNSPQGVGHKALL